MSESILTSKHLVLPNLGCATSETVALGTISLIGCLQILAAFKGVGTRLRRIVAGGS